MKLNKLFMGFLGLGAVALTACSSEDPVSGNQPGEEETRYMSVTIRNANTGGTRGEGDQTADGDRTYEEGYTAENDVKSLRFYFFKDNGDPAPVTFGGSNYYDCPADQITPPEDPDPDINMPNVEKILNAIIVISTNKNESSVNDITQMVALVNFKGVSGITNSNLSLSQLTEIVTSEAAAKSEDNGFLMTSSSFYVAPDESGKSKGLAAQIIPTKHLQSTPELAKQNAVDVYVERVVAKVRVTQAWDETFTEVENVKLKKTDKTDKTNVTFEDGVFTAVLLKDKEGKEIKAKVKVGEGEGESEVEVEKQVYAVFQNWDLWWTADKTNLFKVVGDWDANLGWAWNHPEPYHRSYWAENPDKVKLVNFPHDKANRKFGRGTYTDYATYTAYCLENAADFNNNGFKKPYNPDNATTNRTLVYIKAVLVTLNDAKTEATPLDLAKWGGRQYTKSDALVAMFEPNINQFYFIDTTTLPSESTTDPDTGVITITGGSTWTATSLTVEKVRLVTGLKAGIAKDDKENSERYLSYVNLKDDVDKQLYRRTDTDGVTKYTPVSVDAVNDQLESVGGAYVWDDGATYYYHEIKHLGKTGEDNSTYGVVRNHIYEVELNKVTGLGTPVLIYKDDEGSDKWDEEIIPQKPTPDSYFLGARLNILSWRVVKNGATLDW